MTIVGFLSRPTWDGIYVSTRTAMESGRFPGPALLTHVAPMLQRLGEVVDLSQHKVAELGATPHRPFFAQYRDSVQLDLVVQPASLWFPF